MEGKAIIIFAFKVREKFICLMNFLRILNCCHNSRIMSFITTPFQLPSIKTYMLVPNLCNTIKKWLLAFWFLKILAGNVGDMSALCRPDSQMSALLANISLSWRHKTNSDTVFLCQELPTFTPFFLEYQRYTWRISL